MNPSHKQQQNDGSNCRPHVLALAAPNAIQVVALDCLVHPGSSSHPLLPSASILKEGAPIPTPRRAWSTTCRQPVAQSLAILQAEA
jgi:hypothetical protein